MSDDSRTPSEDSETPRGRKVLGWVIGVPVAILALLLAMHVLIRPIPPGQEEPKTHFGKPCWACHMVSSSADPVELDER